MEEDMACFFCTQVRKILGFSKVEKKDKTAKDEPVPTSSKSVKKDQ